jgi:hypothetical protein
MPAMSRVSVKVCNPGYLTSFLSSASDNAVGGPVAALLAPVDAYFVWNGQVVQM